MVTLLDQYLVGFQIQFPLTPSLSLGSKMVKHHVTFIVAMIEEYERCEKVVLDGAHLTVAKVARIGRARDDNVKVELDTRSCKVGVDNTRAWMEAAVEQGDNIYGMTTGFGACCDKRTLKVETLQVVKILVL